MTINYYQFTKQFCKEYDFLYDHCDNVAGYDEAVDAFDTMCRTNDSFCKFVCEFVNKRRDPISSDREAAAFMFALDALT